MSIESNVIAINQDVAPSWEPAMGHVASTLNIVTLLMAVHHVISGCVIGSEWVFLFCIEFCPVSLKRKLPLKLKNVN